MINRTGFSKATPTTLCQKCLKRGHYSYECTAAQQDRPYQSRPSRTQQLSNPKLKPKLAETRLAEPETLASKINKTREEWVEKSTDKPRGRARSASPDSVSTISTAASRSRSPPGHAEQRRRSIPSTRRRSRSPYRKSEGKALRKRSRTRSPTPSREYRDRHTPKRERSLSPYSKRLALSRQA